MDALPKLVEEKNIAIFEKYGVLSHREMESRFEILVEQYFHTINIEGETAADMARTMILPAAQRYLSELLATTGQADHLGLKAEGILDNAKALIGVIDELIERINALVEQNAVLGGDDLGSKVIHMKENIIPAMARVRDVVDRLEKIIPDDLWPIPSYRDMLFIK